MRNLFASLVFSTAVGLITGSAHATTYSLGEIGDGFSTQHTVTVATDYLSDTFLFDRPNYVGNHLSDLVVTLTSPDIPTLYGVFSYYDFTAGAYNNSIVGTANSGSTMTFEQLLSNQVNPIADYGFSILWPSKVSGSYTLGFKLSSVAPVPEPETWAMLIVGGALLALKLRRRNPAGSEQIVSSTALATAL